MNITDRLVMSKPRKPLPHITLVISSLSDFVQFRYWNASHYLHLLSRLLSFSFLFAHAAKATTSIPAKPLDGNAEWTNNAIKEMKRD